MQILGPQEPFELETVKPVFKEHHISRGWKRGCTALHKKCHSTHQTMAGCLLVWFLQIAEIPKQDKDLSSSILGWMASSPGQTFPPSLPISPVNLFRRNNVWWKSSSASCSSNLEIPHLDNLHACALHWGKEPWSITHPIQSHHHDNCFQWKTTQKMPEGKRR